MVIDIEKIILVQTKVDHQNPEYGFWKVLPPLGLYYLRTAIEQVATIPVKIVDENLPDQKNWLNNGIDKKTLVGFSVNIGNVKGSLEQAEDCKEKGATVIFGGPHASLFGKNIIKKYNFVDGVVITGPVSSEQVMYKIIKGNSWDKINGLAPHPSRSSIQLSITPLFDKKASSEWNPIPYPNRSFIDMKPYFSRVKELDLEYKLPFKRPLSLISHYGCRWRDLSGGCIFCAKLYNQKWQTRSSHNFWEEVIYLRDNFKSDFIRDLGEFCTRSWVKELLKFRPENYYANGTPSFSLYSRASEIDGEMCQDLKALKTFEVRIGIESGDDEILKNMNKGSTSEINERAIKLLSEHRIGASFGIVLGLPGETENSVNNTLKHIEKLNKYDNILSTGVSPMLPVPGSKAFYLLLEENDLKDRYSDSVIFDMEDLQYQWLKRFTNVSTESIYKIIDSIGKMGIRSKAYSLLFN